ncbi:hypothetical protein X975_17993, partial [Stegodyphus mimosarum]
MFTVLPRKNVELSFSAKRYVSIKIMQEHMSAFTGWTLYRLKWDLLPHSLYSPDIAPLDFYLFFTPAGAIFHFAQDVRNEVDLFLDTWPPSF